MRFKDISRSIRAPFNKFGAVRRIKSFHKQNRSIKEIVETGMDLGSRGHYRIDSQQVFSEIEKLVSTVADLKPKNILEIGTCNGGTLFMWSNIATGKVISCDLIANYKRNELFEYFPNPKAPCEVSFVEGDSHTEGLKEKVKNILAGEKVDFLFIDGDHSEKGVEIDYHLYKDLVREGGIIAFHDIVENQPVEGNEVYYFWKRVKQGLNTEEFVNSPDQCGFGIGIVRV